MRRAIFTSLAVGTLLTATLAAAPVANADEVATGEASAHAITASIGGSEAIPPTPDVSVTLPPGGEATDTAIPIPAEPLVFSGTFNASAAVHEASDLESALAVNEQEVAGPYNAQGVGLIEDLDVLVDAVEPGVSLLSADVLRGEAVGVCKSGSVEYSANSEIVNLVVGGEQIPDLNAGLEELIDAIHDILEQSGLNQVVDVERNVVTELDDGIAVDALVITLLEPGGPLLEVRLGHGEVQGLSCGGNKPECSDDVDNADPEDELIDEKDPGCLSGPNKTYNPNDDDETDEEGERSVPSVQDTGLPRTGGGLPGALPMAGGLMALALGALGLRRRLHTV